VLQRYIYLYRPVRPSGAVGPVVADAVAESSVYNSDSCGRDDLGICSVKAAVSEKQNSVSAETEGRLRTRPRALIAQRRPRSTSLELQSAGGRVELGHADHLCSRSMQQPTNGNTRQALSVRSSSARRSVQNSRVSPCVRARTTRHTRYAGSVRAHRPLRSLGR
jgi:hypothetical protein